MDIMEVAAWVIAIFVPALFLNLLGLVIATWQTGREERRSQELAMAMLAGERRFAPIYHFDIQGGVYFVQGVEGGPIKIGYSTDIASRLSALQTGSPVSLDVVAVMDGMPELEVGLHRKFSDARLHGEWFIATPELVAFVKHVRSGGRVRVVRE